MITFRLPDLGEGLSEAEIVTWHVGEGDHVVADQPLLSVETDKAVVEIPSPVSARVLTLHAAAGELVAIDAPLVDLDSVDVTQDAGTVVGSLPIDGSEESAPQVHLTSRRAGVRAKVTPAVRALAADLDVALDTLQGSGPQGSITRADVYAAAGDRSETVVTDAGQSGVGGGIEGSIEPMRGVRRAMSQNMVLAHQQVVPATLTEVADIDGWAIDEEVTQRLIRALCAACQKEPALNAAYIGLQQGRRLNERVDLGIAMDTDQGLFVPVLRDVARRSTDDLHTALERMKADVRARRVPREELRGATITLSNFGMLGGLHAALVVVPPQVAIVGAGRVHECARPVRGEIVIRRVVPLSLTFDHRAVTGSEAARFMSAMCADLAAP